MYSSFIQVMGKLVCNYVCKVYHTEILTDLMKHIRLFRSHQPNFSMKCGIGGCQRTFSRFGTFQNHISAYHRAEPNPTNVEEYLRRHDGAGGGDDRTDDGGADDGGAGADDGNNGTGESDDDSHDGDSTCILMNATSFKFKTFEWIFNMPAHMIVLPR